MLLIVGKRVFLLLVNIVSSSCCSKAFHGLYPGRHSGLCMYLP